MFKKLLVLGLMMSLVIPVHARKIGKTELSNADTDTAFKITQVGVLADGEFALYVSADTVQPQGNSPLVQFRQGHAGSTADVLKLSNEGTGCGLHLKQEGNLGLGKYSLYVTTDTVQSRASTPLVLFGQGNSSSTAPTLRVSNRGMGHGIHIQQNQELAAGKHALYVYSNADQDNSQLVYLRNDNAASSSGGMYIYQDGIGTGLHVQMTNRNGPGIQITHTAAYHCLGLTNDGNGPHIKFTGDPTVGSPVDGDAWFNGTDIYLRVGATTYTLNKTSVSDERVKKDIKDTKSSLKDLLKIEVKDYKFKKKYGDDTKEYTGMLAQSLKSKYSYAVEPVDIPGLKNAYKINYRKLIPLLIKSVQELNEKVEDLEDRVETLESQ